MLTLQRFLNHLSTVLSIMVLFAVFTARFDGQEMVDKTVATVSDGTRVELITYSELKWQLALQPGVALDPPRSEDLNRALQTLIDQRLFALEAERLPRNAPTEAEVSQAMTKILAFFPSTAAFETRLKQVGFESVKDDNFENIIRQRVAIENYISFRFTSFVVVTPDEETRYYRDILVPDFRRRFPGLLMPTLDERRRSINQLLTEERVATRIESFLDEAKRRLEIFVLIEV